METGQTYPGHLLRLRVTTLGSGPGGASSGSIRGRRDIGVVRLFGGHGRKT